MDGWKWFKQNDETQLYNDFSQCQKHYGLVASLLLPYATKIRWLEDSLIAVGASDLQASLNEIQCPRDVKPGSQAGYNGRGWTMVKKKLCLKVISSNETSSLQFAKYYKNLAGEETSTEQILNG